MLLAGDVGGTKTLLGLFDAQSSRPTPLAVSFYAAALLELGAASALLGWWACTVTAKNLLHFKSYLKKLFEK
jgi:demethoxyubiquinone hydroxylase (CLK1/Coq7/Cat5 family)